MSLPAQVTRGARVLRRLLREQTFDVRALDLAGFRRWLDAQLARWRNDPAFAQRARIRDLRRAHPELRALESERRRLDAADAASPHGARLRALEQELDNAGRAVAGLTAALGTAAVERWAALHAKRETFAARRRALEEEQASLLAASPERQALLRADAELRRLRAATGLDAEEVRLAERLRQQGQRSGRGGRAFEELALALTRDHLTAELVRGDAAGRRLRVLRGVTLGAARTELDLVVIRPPPVMTRPVDVLAVIEGKRNVNDLGHGFRLRQENLAWLTGDAAGYDPAAYRTGYFRSGHFDREALHREGGERFVFAPTSFRRFRRDAATGWFLRRLYFFTRAGPLWGLAGAALARVGQRVATDERWGLENDAYQARLLEWCQSLAVPPEAPDVLGLYAAEPARARRILVVGP